MMVWIQREWGGMEREWAGIQGIQSVRSVPSVVHTLSTRMVRNETRMGANPEDGIRFIREIRGSNLFYAIEA
jgi:hypothetical protein